MRIRFLVITFLFFSVNLRAQENKLSLKQCIETALKNNTLVKQAGLQADAEAINVKQARANMLPDLNANFGYGFNRGRNVDPLTNSYINQQLASSNVGLSSGIILFNGMRFQNLVQQNNLNYAAAKMDLQQQKDNLTLNVILAYLQVLSNADVLAANNAQIAVTKTQAERIEILVKEGAAAGYLLADLKGQVANEEISIINAANALEIFKLNLSQLMGVAYSSNMELENEAAAFPLAEYTNSAAELYKTSLQNFALLKAHDLKIKSAQKAIRVSQAGFYPRIGLSANLGSSYSSLAQTLRPANISEVQTGNYIFVNGLKNEVLTQQQNFSFSKTGYARQLNNNLGNFVGINMQIPLFNSWQTKNNIKLAKINAKNTQLQSDNAKLELQQNIEQAHLNMKAAFEKYKVLNRQVVNFEESFRAAEVRFNSGVINAAEYLVSKNNFDRSKINEAQARYEYSFRIRVLDYYEGTIK